MYISIYLCMYVYIYVYIYIYIYRERERERAVKAIAHKPFAASFLPLCKEKSNNVFLFPVLYSSFLH